MSGGGANALYSPQLATFLCVADAGRFNRAAEELFISPSAVIKQIHHKVMGQECTDVHFAAFESKDCAIREIRHPSASQDRKHIRNERRLDWLKYPLTMRYEWFILCINQKGGASMQVSLKPWGNSQGVRFSREFLASAGIKPDDVLIAEVSEGRIILRKSFQHRTLKQRAEEFGGSLNLSEEVVWDDPKGNEMC